MGLYDRDYYREPEYRAFHPTGRLSLVVWLIIINAVIWLVQVILLVSPAASHVMDSIFGCSPSGVFEKGWIWQPLTANFLHSPFSPAHIFFNMLLLFFFGRELEELYGRRDFLIFYLAAGAIGMLAEIGLAALLARGPVVVYGASGAVSGLIVLFTWIYPTRRVWIWGIFPMPVWGIALLYLVMNVWGVTSPVFSPDGGSTSTAYVCHLAGMAVGTLYRFVDLRWKTIRNVYLGGLFPRSGRRVRSPARQRGKIIAFPGRSERDETPEAAPYFDVDASSTADDPEVEEISLRIDELLDKISREGQDSLSDDELEFLRQNSQRYRSRR